MTDESEDDARICPICHREMEDEDRDGVTVDVCSEHGIRLDRGDQADLPTRLHRQLDPSPAT